MHRRHAETVGEMSEVPLNPATVAAAVRDAVAEVETLIGGGRDPRLLAQARSLLDSAAAAAEGLSDAVSATGSPEERASVNGILQSVLAAERRLQVACEAAAAGAAGEGNIAAAAGEDIGGGGGGAHASGGGSQSSGGSRSSGKRPRRRRVPHGERGGGEAGATVDPAVGVGTPAAAAPGTTPQKQYHRTTGALPPPHPGLAVVQQQQHPQQVALLPPLLPTQAAGAAAVATYRAAADALASDLSALRGGRALASHAASDDEEGDSWPLAAPQRPGSPQTGGFSAGDSGRDARLGSGAAEDGGLAPVATALRAAIVEQAALRAQVHALQVRHALAVCGAMWCDDVCG